ncbi:MAG: cyclase family protein [Oscillospiraceae bacterium]|jgi:arylformamidase|nr:cyclase family protein [Oscillospiraceae bacterium]
MNIIDITQPLFSCEVFPGDPAPSFERVKTISGDNLYNLTNISLCVHNGTHIDAPRHFLAEGAGAGDLPLSIFHGGCCVKEWDGEIPANCERLLLKGSYELSAEDAKLLVRSGVKLIGVEAQSVGPAGAPLEVHLILLKAGVIPLEGIVLSNVEPGEYTLSAFPLNLGSGCDGSPVRAVLY